MPGIYIYITCSLSEHVFLCKFESQFIHSFARGRRRFSSLGDGHCAGLDTIILYNVGIQKTCDDEKKKKNSNQRSPMIFRLIAWPNFTLY